MHRDIKKSIEKGKAIIAKNCKKDLTLSDLEIIRSISADEGDSDMDMLFYAISNAYLAGLAEGVKIKA